MRLRKLAMCGILAITLGCVTFLTAGCPASDAKGDVTLLFTGDSGAKAGEIDVNLIQSFTVEITKITLRQTFSQAVIFEGSQDADLIDLSGISTMLSSANIAAGTYNRIELTIANPRLVLKATPDTVLTNIQLTADSRMFVSGSFVVPEDGNTVIRLDFGGIHLVPAADKYVLTPQLRADVVTAAAPAPVKNEGEITAINTVDSTLTLPLPSGDTEVAYGTATITIAGTGGDPDTPGTAADLAIGQWIQVVGTVNADGVIVATTILITL